MYLNFKIMVKDKVINLFLSKRLIRNKQLFKVQEIKFKEEK